MASKNKLKYSRLPPALELLDTLIDKCLAAIGSPGFKASMPNLIHLIRLRLKLQPPERVPPKIIWID